MELSTFVSDLYVGYISDIQLTLECGLIQMLDMKGKTYLHNQSKTKHPSLFMEERARLLSKEVNRKRTITSLCIYIERSKAVLH